MYNVCTRKLEMLSQVHRRVSMRFLRSTSLNRRYLSTPNSVESDADVHARFNSLGSMISRLYRTTEGEQKEQYEKYCKSKDGLFYKVSKFDNGFLFRLLRRLTFSYLQHPLLLKYGFDETEFAIAVRDAYPIIIKALMSPDFHDFVHRKTESSPSHDYIKSISSPEFFQMALETLKTADRPPPLDAATVLNMHPSYVRVSIRDSEEDDEDPRGSATGAEYPDGSVVLSIGLRMEVQHFSSVAAATTEEVHATFEACISGHIEMDWRVGLAWM